MPQSKSMKKRLRQSQPRRIRNIGRKRAIKLSTRRTLDAATAGDADATREALSGAFKALDKAAQRGVIHKKTAARRKARLHKRIAQA